MKKQTITKLLSAIFAMLMIVSLLPALELPALAADTEITAIKSVMASDTVPKAGKEVRHFMPSVPDGQPYQRDIDGSEWYDSNGVKIAPTVNHHYDIGYEFEAGHTYYVDCEYTANYGYVFAQNPTITLTGPDPSMFTYEIVDRWDNNRGVTVRYTFTIPGDYENADINKVSMQYYGTPRDGAKKPDRCGLIYNNCTITSEEWNTGTWGSNSNWGVYEEDGSNAPTFLAGETYVHMIKLTAKNGYKFSPGLHVQKGTQDAEEYGVVSLSADRTVATVKFTYEIPSVEIIDTIDLVAANQHMYFCLRSGESIYLPQPFIAKYAFDANCPYKVDGVNACEWYVTETEEFLRLGYPHTFENGKKYTLKFNVRIKDEYITTHKFANGLDLGLNITDYQYANSDFVEFKISGGDQLATVEVTFTCRFPDDVGQTADKPAMCYSYEEFKYAMEDPNIRYVALGNVDEVMPRIDGDGIVTAISVNGIKHLQLLGDATFTAPAGDGYKTFVALLHTEQDATLTVSGNGSLKFRAVASNSYNAVIYNQGGSVIISSGTLIGSFNTAVYGKAIWQEYGDLRISGGQFFAENALAPGRLPGPVTAVYINGGKAWISGGTFKTENKISTIDLPYGLDIGQYATVDLSGGTFYGILLPKSSTPLANYMDEETYTPLSNESKFNPASEYSQEYVGSGKVTRIAWLIDHVDVHVNAPIAGVDIKENYFNIPTSGCKVTMYYPQWYKNGESVTYGTFEAGASYKVVVWVDVKADYGAEFSNGVTVAINNQSVAVDRKSSHLIAVEYDFGVCPNVVSQVDLTVTAPKEGNKPSYSVSCGSNAYYAVGGSSNYTEYRTWYMSSDNDDWWEINGSHSFMAGYYYKLVVDIRTNNGYEFPVYDNGSSIVPGVNAYVNDYAATVIKAYDQDPSRYITVEYNFGECNDSVVEIITITNIDAPTAGQTPDYLANCFGTGYSMASTNSGNWKVNGIVWLRDGDIYTGSIMDNTEKFQAGHKYTVMIDLVPDYGYTFLFNHNNSIYATSSINGNTAQITIDNCSTTKYQVWYTFTCEAKEITTIMLYNLDLPVGGNKPDTSVTPAYPEYYVVESVKWFDIEDNPAGEVFESGVPYYALITVAPATGVVFADPENMTAYIDGNILPGVDVKNNKVIIPVIIRKPASAPIVNPYVFLTQPQGGTVMVGEALNTPWETSFIPTRNEIQYWDGKAWDQWDVQYPQNALDDYDFESDDAGSYRFRIAAYVGNQVVATSNEFVITWEEETATEFIYVYGVGEGQGSGDYDYVTAGTRITLYTPEELGIFPIDGFEFDYWSIRKGTAMSAEVAQKQPGDQIIIDDNTYIIAMWKATPHIHSYDGTYRHDVNTHWKQCCDPLCPDVEGSITEMAVCVPANATCKVKGTCFCGNTLYGDCDFNSGVFVYHNAQYHVPKCKYCNNTANDYKAHAGGTATCTAAAKCTDCKQSYGSTDPNRHSGSLQWTKTAQTHEKKYSCCGAVAVARESHEWLNGICKECEYVCLHSADSNKDHICDTCGKTIGIHEAAAGKHTCDYCGKAVTQCTDTNKDHRCDTCGKAIGVHEAAAGKHTCDYCGKTVTECADSNSDGKCDTCGKKIGDCTDADRDHKCDKHGESMGTHEAALGKHSCDYCGANVTACEDANKDHKCDTCEATMGSHEAAAGKHSCDYCGKTVTECTDTNKDHKCDVCGAVMGNHEAASGSHSCEYCGETLSACADTNGDDKCDICGKTLTSHTHEYGSEYLSNENEHWKECECGQQVDKAAHVDADKSGRCDTCDRSLPSGGDETPPTEHVHSFGNWESNGNEHWKACACGEKAETAAHSGGTASCQGKAKCAVCNAEYGSVAEHHDGNADGTCDGCDYRMTDDDPAEPGDEQGLSAGVIIGIVVGAVAIGILSGFLVIKFGRKKS